MCVLHETEALHGTCPGILEWKNWYVHVKLNVCFINVSERMNEQQSCRVQYSTTMTKKKEFKKYEKA